MRVCTIRWKPKQNAARVACVNWLKSGGARVWFLGTPKWHVEWPE